MSILLFFEVEVGVDLDVVLCVLDLIQVEYFDGIDCIDGLCGYFLVFNIGFGFGIVDLLEVFVVEGIEVEWQVGLLGLFYFCVSGFESVWEEICCFIKCYVVMWGFGLCFCFSLRVFMW